MISPPPADGSLIQVQDIRNAGRGVVALRPIPQGTTLLESSPPAASVIFRPYRREVCARCFRYDLGRTLAVRHASTGKVFCSADCQGAWVAEEGELGVEAWGRLHAFVQARVRDVADGYEGLPDRGGKPGTGEVEAAWRDAEESSKAKAVKGGKKSRRSSSNHSAGIAKPTIDPDILNYLLSSILSHHKDPTPWTAEVSALIQDPDPYRSTQELHAYTISYQHLATILPAPLLTASCTPSTCHLAVAAASHNSFGIRSADGEEYMGYALHPNASYFNHSCEPNLSKLRVGRHWVFSADRDIAVGEECCITYMGGDEKDLDVGERRARLLEHWGFTCMCFRCLREGGTR